MDAQVQILAFEGGPGREAGGGLVSSWLPLELLAGTVSVRRETLGLEEQPREPR